MKNIFEQTGEKLSASLVALLMAFNINAQEVSTESIQDMFKETLDSVKIGMTHIESFPLGAGEFDTEIDGVTHHITYEIAGEDTAKIVKITDTNTKTGITMDYRDGDISMRTRLATDGTVLNGSSINQADGCVDIVYTTTPQGSKPLISQTIFTYTNEEERYIKILHGQKLTAIDEGHCSPKKVSFIPDLGVTVPKSQDILSASTKYKLQRKVVRDYTLDLKRVSEYLESTREKTSGDTEQK